MSQDLQQSRDFPLPGSGSERRTAPPPPPLPPVIPPLRSELRRPARLGALILVAFFLVGGGWAATAPISGATIAAGVVSPEGSRQRIQHLEGGIIHEIRVHEGEHVQAGDVLMVLADVAAQAEVGQLTGRLQALAGAEARLIAERQGAATVSFAHPSLADRSNLEVQKLIVQQVNQFITRKANDESQEAILTQRVAQLKQQIVGAEKQVDSVRRQLHLIQEEIAVVKDMFERGYEKKSRLLALQRSEADLQGQEGELLSRIARAEEQIGETKLQMINVRTKRKEDTDQDLAETQAKRIEVEQQIKHSLDKLTRTAIVAPMTGTVLDVRFKTTNGVVRPGEEVLSIIPDEGELIVDARISPKDVDDVHAGQHGYVIFPSFSQRNLHRIGATVRSVSADAFQEERTGERFYTAKVKVDREQLRKLDPDVQLTPGMPAEVFISTANRTLLEYLLQPLQLTIERSFREH